MEEDLIEAMRLATLAKRVEVERRQVDINERQVQLNDEERENASEDRAFHRRAREVESARDQVRLDAYLEDVKHAHEVREKTLVFYERIALALEALKPRTGS